MTVSAGKMITPAGLAEVASRGAWKPAKHLRLVSKHLMRLAGGHDRRLALNMPPRHGKTLLAARYFPFWFLGTFPDREVVIATASDGLATDHGRFVRDLVEEWGPTLFGISIRPSKAAAGDWQIIDARTGRVTGGGLRAVGTGTALLGRGADLVVLDDLYGSVKDVSSPAYREMVGRWFSQTVLTRLSPRGVVLSIGSRMHYDDLFGRQERAEEEGGDKWVRLVLPALAGPDDPLGREDGAALWPERYPLADLERIRAAFVASGNLKDWSSNYQCNPPMGDGATQWPDSYFASPGLWFDDWPDQSKILRSILSVDTSKGTVNSDWQAFNLSRLDQQGHFWLDQSMVKLDDTRLLEHAAGLVGDWRPDMTVIETNGAGYVLCHHLARRLVHGQLPHVVGRSHSEDKETRIAIRLTPLLAAGRLHLKRGSPGCKILLEQLRNFPNHANDDGPDSLEMGLELQGHLLTPRHKQTVRYTNPHK